MRERATSYEARMKRPALRITSTAGSFAPQRAAPHRFAATPDIKSMSCLDKAPQTQEGIMQRRAKRRDLYQGLVEPDGIEPTTSAVRLLRSPN